MSTASLTPVAIFIKALVMGIIFVIVVPLFKKGDLKRKKNLIDRLVPFVDEEIVFFLEDYCAPKYMNRLEKLIVGIEKNKIPIEKFNSKMTKLLAKMAK